MARQMTRQQRQVEKRARAYLSDANTDGGRSVDHVAAYLLQHFPNSTLAQRRTAVIALRSSCSCRFEAFPERNGAPAGVWLVEVASGKPLTIETYEAAIRRARKLWRRLWPT